MAPEQLNAIFVPPDHIIVVSTVFLVHTIIFGTQVRSGCNSNLERVTDFEFSI